MMLRFTACCFVLLCVVSAIQAKSCGSKNCIRKCCPVGQKLESASSCISEPNKQLSFATTFEKMACSNRTTVVGDRNPDETVIYSEVNEGVFNFNGEIYKYEDFCVDYFKDTTIIIVCISEVDQDNDGFKSIGMIISMPFLFVTFMVYAVLPERNLHMKAMMSYVATLLIAYIILVTIQLSNTNFPAAVCTLLGFACAFFFMVSFFWMNVICIDVWFGFRGFRTRGSGETKRFLLYSLYAWGMPIVLVFIIFLLQTFGEPDSWYHPGIGTGQCFIKTGAPYNLYFYLPIAILIILNVVFFVSTALKIRSIKKDTAVLKREDSRKHSYENDKQQFNLYLKLLLAMGINWTMEIISGIVMQKFKSIPTWIWYLTDFCNASYGVFIFFIFVCKRNIWLQVKRRYYTFMGKPYRAHQTYPTKTTSMSTSHTTHSIVESQADSMALSQRSSHNA